MELLPFIACILFLISPAFCLKGLDYSSLSGLGVSCPHRDSCQHIGTSDFLDRNCECDSMCRAFRDCCIDAQVPMMSRRYRDPRLNCMAYGDDPNLGAYVVDTCPPNYSGPVVVRSRCIGEVDVGDPLVAAPVTDPSSDVTYRNRYCAECNNAVPSVLKSWLIFMNCESLANLNVNDTYVWQNLVYSNYLDSWGVDFDDEFHTCRLVFDKPAYISSGVRLCRANLVSSCHPDWNRPVVRRYCRSYTAMVYAGNVTYRNPHCALCNGLNSSQVVCERGGLTHRAKNKPFSFALLLDVNRSDGDVVGMVDKCATGEKYDPFFKKCRTLVCALPGYKMVDGKCKKEVVKE